MDFLTNADFWVTGPDLGLLMYACAVGLAVIGLVGVATASNLVRIVLALALLEAGANLLLLLAGYKFGAAAPIIVAGVDTSVMVDPVPQAMVLTAIVIGVGIQALAMSIVLKVHRVYATLDIRVLLKKMEQDIDAAAGIAADASSHLPTEAGIPVDSARRFNQDSEFRIGRP